MVPHYSILLFSGTIIATYPQFKSSLAIGTLYFTSIYSLLPVIDPRKNFDLDQDDYFQFLNTNYDIYPVFL